jgi:precorrin-3B synthase
MLLCEAARRYGNGVIEVTGRGSIQLRGLTPASAPDLADAVAALGIAAADGIAVVTHSLAGLAADEILDAEALAAELRQAVSRASLTARLAPKISVAVDGGGAHGIDDVPADIRLHAATISGKIALRLTVGGDAANAALVGSIAPTDSVEATLRLLEVLAASGRDVRARDVLKARGLEPFRAALGDIRVVSESGPNSRFHERKADAIGLHRLRDGTLACGVGLAFGHADAATLKGLAEAADASRAAGIRAGAGRVLMTVGLTQNSAAAFAASAERLDFIVSTGDPRRRVIACAGSPVCSSAHIAARALAPRVAELLAAGQDDTRIVHISGCAKGCAHAGKAALTVVGRPDGCALVANGSVHDAPVASVASAEILDAIAMYEGRHV